MNNTDLIKISNLVKSAGGYFKKLHERVKRDEAIEKEQRLSAQKYHRSLTPGEAAISSGVLGGVSGAVYGAIEGRKGHRLGAAGRGTLIGIPIGAAAGLGIRALHKHFPEKK